MKNKTYYLVTTCENEPVAVYESLNALHRDLRHFNMTCRFEFARFKDMQLYTGEDDKNPSYSIICIRNDVFWGHPKNNKKGQQNE